MHVLDVIDIVKDQLTGGDYVREEDPKLFVSEKTGRGPLSDEWLEEYWREVQGKKQPTARNMSLMCAYKICRVEFRYWGMQTKLEKFIHDIALRKTMVRAHRQAWAWQDEWHGLTIDDVREIERQTQLALARKMGGGDLSGDDEEEEDEEEEEEGIFCNSQHLSKLSLYHFPTLESVSEGHDQKPDKPVTKEERQNKEPPVVTQEPPSEEVSSDDDGQQEQNNSSERSRSQSIQMTTKSKYGSKAGGLHSPLGSAHSFELQVRN